MTAEFEFPDEILELREMVRDFCREYSSESVVRTTMESELGFEPVLWRRLGTELGVLGLSVPDTYGGADAGLVAQAVAIEELGAALLCGPVLGTLALAIPALCALSDEHTKRRLLPPLCAGEQTATLIAPIVAAGFDDESITVHATEDTSGWRLTGAVGQVPDAAAADVILVVADDGTGELGLFAVEAGSAGLSCAALSTLDLTRRQAAVAFDATPATRISEGAEVREVVEHVALVAATLIAVEQVGGAQRMLDTTVAHVSTRLQFGQPVGSYQAVKHRCANMLIAIEQARSAAFHGAWALQDGIDDPRLAVSLAKAVASEAFSWVTGSAIQLHGGIGFTWEGSPQLYFKRAATDALTLGSAAQHIEQVAQRAIDQTAPAV